MSVDRGAYMREIRDLLDANGIKVGMGVAPKDPGGMVPYPFTVLYAQWSNPFGESVGCFGEGAVLNFRLISTAITAEGAEGYAATVDAAIRDQVVTVAGRESYPIRWRETSAVERDDDVSPPCFYVSALYSVMTASTEES